MYIYVGQNLFFFLQIYRDYILIYTVRASLGAQLVKNLPAMQETLV